MSTVEHRRLDEQARRLAKKVGLRARRLLGRRAASERGQGFGLFDGEGNCVAGDGYTMSVEDVIKFCNRIP